MKKILCVVFLFMLVVSQVFAYKWFEEHKSTPSGKTTIHYKLYTHNSVQDNLMKEWLKGQMTYQLENAPPASNYDGGSGIDYVSDIVVKKTGKVYRVVMIRVLTSNGIEFSFIKVLMTNLDSYASNDSDGGIILEDIYQSEFYYSFNLARAEYDRLCEKYINMID